ncbi:MAG TPA: hypothetical protein VHA56_19765 [Mucilaginibacter sp.]|nr:hypothetical protein [Mucilaginibacter sp.]
MADIRVLHWNIETYGPAKYFNANNANFINYIARIVYTYDVEIFCMVEVKNSTSLLVPPLLAAAINALEGILPANNPWKVVRANSNFNNEAYIMMYRIDKDFLPVNTAQAAGPNVVPEHGLGNINVAGAVIQFPSRWTGNGGRRPFYATFETNNMAAETFSVISYHAMFGPHTPQGINRLPNLRYITQFHNGTPIDESIISGDFNVEFDPAPTGWYGNMLAITSYATDEATTLQNNPIGGNDPATFMASAYDNIFQTVVAMSPAGEVNNLMIDSANVPAPQPPPPAAQPNVGDYSAEAGAYNIAALNNYLARIVTPVVALPPVDMNTSWDFVREAISNHYPVFLEVTI